MEQANGQREIGEGSLVSVAYPIDRGASFSDQVFQKVDGATPDEMADEDRKDAGSTCEKNHDGRGMLM